MFALTFNQPVQANNYLPVKDSFGKKAGRVYSAAYKHSEHAWNYIGKLESLARQTLNTLIRTSRLIALTGKRFTKNVTTAITSMKLLSIVGISFSLVSLKNTALKIFQQMRYRDAEGVALGSLSFTITAGGVFDSVTTFVNAVLTLASKPVVGLFSAVGIPLGLALSSLGIIQRGIDITKAFSLYCALPPEDAAFQPEALQGFLEKALGVTAKESKRIHDKAKGNAERAGQLTQRLKDKKQAALLRSATGGAAKELTELRDYLLAASDLSAEDVKAHAAKVVNHVCSKLKQKIGLDFMGIVANLFSIAALALLCVGIVTPVPFIFFALSLVIKLIALVLQDVLK